MKKFTLLIASLFITIGAMAQFDANKYYTVVAEGHSKGGSPAWAVNDDGTSFVSTGNTTIANEAQQYFAFITYNEATYIYSVSAKKFVKNDASLSADGADAVTIEALTDTNAGKYLFKFDNDHFINIGGSKQMVIDGWGDGANEVDGGNTMTVTAAGEFTVEDLAEATKLLSYIPNFTGAKTRTTERKIASFTVNDDTYTLTSNEQLQNYVVKTDKVFTVGAGSEVTVAITHSDGSSWMNAFVYIDTDKNGFTAGIADDNYTPTGDLVSYSFYNQGYSDDNNGRNSAGTSISSGNRSTLALPTFTAPETPGTYRLRAKYDWCNINPAGDTGTYFGNTFTGHGAAIIDFTIVVTEPLPEFNATYRLTDQTGNVYEGQFVYNTQNHPALTGAHSATFSNEAWDEANLLYTATVDFGFPVSKKDGATNETLLKVHNTSKYIRNIDGHVKVSNADVDANCLWAIYPEFNEGAFTFEIMNVATGKYLYTTATERAHNTEGTVVLSSASTKFTVPSLNDFKVADKDLYLSINSPAYDNDVYLGLYDGAHDGTNVNAVELPYYQVAITDAKYATFYAPVAVTVPDGVTAHTVTINGDWATLSDPLEVIPAYTGVVLYSETAQAYTFNVTTADAFEGENALKGTVAATNVTADAYVLGYINVAEEGEEEKKEVGFYTATKNQADNTAFLNNHHKAYLPKTTGMNAVSYSFRFGEGTTGIDEITENRVQSTVIYDLTGRRVETITEPGIYIVNGKKVLVK